MIPVTIANDGTVTKADESTEWYNYSAKKWANAVVLSDYGTDKYYDSPPGTIIDGYILAYYVWIPRYKYAITNGTGSRLVDIVFESKTATKSTGNSIGTSYRTHPAFTFGTEEISGFWFGKFETSGDKTDPEILPERVPLTGINVKEAYLTAFTFTNYFKSSVDAHMAKNNEWCAVAYMINSKYGRCTGTTCTEVSVNNAYDRKTGYSAGKPADSNTMNMAYYSYETEQGYLASTTANISGIYDMSGGAREYVMENYNNVVGSSGFTELPWPLRNNKYYQKYTSPATTACNGGICYGDALLETAGWNGDFSDMPADSRPWFARGGRRENGVLAGPFRI